MFDVLGLTHRVKSIGRAGLATAHEVKYADDGLKVVKISLEPGDGRVSFD